MSLQVMFASVCGRIGLTLRVAFAALVVCPAVASAAAYFQNSGQQVIVGNDQVELTFNAGNGSLLNLVDKVTGRDLISRKVANYNGFFFRFTTPTNSTPQQGGGYMGRLQALTPVRVTTGVQITMKFGQFNVSGTTLNLTATLVITVDDSSPLTSWQLSINNPEQITIESVALPSIAGIGQLSDDPANDYLVYPSLSGVFFQDPAHNFALNSGYGGGGNYPNGFNNMQFLAYYSTESGAGLYLASEDSAGYAKTMNAGKLGTDWMNLAHAYVPPFRLATDVTIPYVVKLGVFHGDWFDAASLYRAWAIQQPWAQGGPLATRTDVPNWYKNTGMMAYIDTFSGLGQSYASLAQAAAAWQQGLQSQPVINWIAWENQGPWVDIPDFLPPSQGWPAFDSAVSATHAAGGRLMVEPSTSYATVGTPSWSTLQAAASQQADGSMYLQQQTTLNQSYQSGSQTNAQMDPTQPWHDAILNLTSQLQQHGIDLIHMDGNPFPQGLCYATNHSHLPGGGNWWFQDYAQIYSDIRRAGRAVNPNFAMGGEWYAEPYLGLTDSGQDETNTGFDPSAIGGGSVLDHTKASFIPLWQAVYHDYTLTYSMHSAIDGQNIQYNRRGLALPLIWGEIPMILANDGVPYGLNSFNSTLVQYVQRIVSLRTTYGHPFVVLGRMLRPPQPAVPEYTVPPVNHIPYTGVNTSAFSTPSILSSAWQSPQGDAALIFTNISDSTVSFSWTIIASDVSLDSSQTYDLFVVKNGTCVSRQPSVSLPYTLTVTTNSTDIEMLILSQSANGGTSLPCSRPFDAGGQALSPSPGDASINLTFPAGFSWTATTTANWITFTGPTSGVGNGTLSYQVTANTGADRTATITVAGYSFTIEQQAGSIPGLTFIGSLPHLAAEGGWNTTFTLVNKSSATVQTRPNLFGGDGSPLALPLTFPQQPPAAGPLLGASVDRTLAANASLIVQASGPASIPYLEGSAQLAATGAIDGFEIFHYDPTMQEAVVPLETRNASSYLLAYDQTNEVVLGVAVENVSAQAANIPVVIRDDTGTQIGTGSISLNGNGHKSFVLSTQFPATAKKRGTVEFDTPPGGQISALGIRFTPPNLAMTTIPVLANVGTSGGSIAHLATGHGWQTTFVLVNTGASAAQVHLKFFADVTGAPLSLPLSFPQSASGTAASSVDQTLAAGATLVVLSAAPLSNPTPTTGSAQLTTDGKVSGFVIFRYNPNGQEAVVPLESRNANAYILAFDNTGGTATGLAINSVSSQAVNVPVVIRDDTGAQIATDTIPLAANGHLSFTLVTDKYPATANIRGTIEFDAPPGAQIGALGIRVPATLTFTTLPALVK